MGPELDEVIQKLVIWGVIWLIAFEAMAANKRQGG
jgi:hypothetical protein